MARITIATLSEIVLAQQEQIESLQVQVEALTRLTDAVASSSLNMSTAVEPTTRRRTARKTTRRTGPAQVTAEVDRAVKAAKPAAKKAQGTSRKPKPEHYAEKNARNVGFVRLGSVVHELVENGTGTRVYPKALAIRESSVGNFYVGWIYDKAITVEMLKAAGARKISEKTFENVRAALVREANAKNGN